MLSGRGSRASGHLMLSSTEAWAAAAKTMLSRTGAYTFPRPRRAGPDLDRPLPRCFLRLAARISVRRDGVQTIRARPGIDAAAEREQLGIEVARLGAFLGQRCNEEAAHTRRQDTHSFPPPVDDLLSRTATPIVEAATAAS